MLLRLLLLLLRLRLRLLLRGGACGRLVRTLSGCGSGGDLRRLGGGTHDFWVEGDGDGVLRQTGGGGGWGRWGLVLGQREGGQEGGVGPLWRRGDGGQVAVVAEEGRVGAVARGPVSDLRRGLGARLPAAPRQR